jgi:hypothetical protein
MKQQLFSYAILSCALWEANEIPYAWQ